MRFRREPLSEVRRVFVAFWRTERNSMKLINQLKRHQFLLEELVKRDFNRKYKRAVLGVLWSVLAPLLTLLVMKLVFTQFFGRNTPHYTTYLFAGNLIFSYFKESTNGGMSALTTNARIFTKINIPKYMFLLSKNVSSIINFGITLLVFFGFAALDGITFTWKFLALAYPIVLLVLFNIGMGLILSAMFVFFRDTQYLYDIFTLMLMYVSAIFYRIDSYPATIQHLFLLNPIYCIIYYFRQVVIDGVIPSLGLHGLIALYTLLSLGIGCLIYKKKNQKFLYYV